MSGIFRGLQIGLSTLMAHQRAIDITSQNMANVNTRGYQRQRVNLSELSGPSGMINPPIIGNGVYAGSVSRYATPFIDQQIRRQNGSHQYSSSMEDFLRDVESIVAEPSATGINASLDSFWQAWQDLAVAPTEQATRIALVQSAAQVSSTIREASDFVTSLSANLSTQIGAQVNRINEIATEIGGLNRQIIQANAQTTNNGAIPLEQRRDDLFFELSEIVDFDLSYQDGGMARITIGNYALVDDGGARPIQMDQDDQPVWSGNGAEFKVTSGKLKAFMELRDETLPGIVKGLDQLARGLIENVNNIHRNGYGVDGTTGIDFFKGESSKTIDVNPILFRLPETIASAGEPNRIGDISVAQEIAQLASKPSMGNGISINGFYRTLVTQIGMKTQQAAAHSESSRIVTEHLSDRRQAISGVSMDEEVANLLSYEKAFQAGGRIINVIDEMLDQVINRMGVVGR